MKNHLSCQGASFRPGQTAMAHKDMKTLEPELLLGMSWIWTSEFHRYFLFHSQTF